MSDNYDFAKSIMPQGVDLETPYVSKQYNFINDINSGVYSNSGLSLVQFDLSSIFNSQGFLSPADMFITIPITYVQALVTSTSTGALAVPSGTGGDWARLGLKSGYWNLISSADLQVNGKTVEQYQPNLNVYTGIKLLSQMSVDDLNSFGMSLGMGRQLDNPESIKFNNTASATATGVFPAGTPPIGGNGLSNCAPFSTPADGGDQAAFGVQNSNTYNTGLYSRLNKITDTTNVATSTNMYGTAVGGTLMSATNLANEFRPTFQITPSGYMVWYDIAVIRLKDIFDSMKSFPLVKKFDGILRIYVNTGVVGTSTVVAIPGSEAVSASTNTFSNCCPLVVTSVAAPAVTAGVVVGQVSGLFIAKATQTSMFGGVNLALSGASCPMPSCRVYFAQVILKPERAISYVGDNRAKKVCYTAMLANQFNSITAGSSFSALVQSGVSKIRSVIIMPLLAASTNGLLTTGANAITGITSFSPLLSPFDMCPNQNGPLSLTNLQVAIGGTNQLNSTLLYTYENFLEQVSLYEKLGASDLGVSCGLISQYMWEQGSPRFYLIDCSRGQLSDAVTARNINVSFTNNTQQTIDCLIFTEYFQELVVDVESGQVKM